MEEINVKIPYNAGKRLYKVVNGELKFFDIEEVNITIREGRDPFVKYKLRVNMSSGSREEEYGDSILNYSVTPEEAIEKSSIELLNNFYNKHEQLDA